jgi:hypothetical protein
MWPVSAKAGIRKMRAYGKKKRSVDEVEAEAQEEAELPKLPPTRPDEIWNTASTIRALEDRDPTKFSDNSVQVYHETLKSVSVQLQKGLLVTMEYQALQTKVLSEYNRKAKSRKSTHKGGASVPISQLRTEIKVKEKEDKAEALRKAEKKLSQAINRAKNELKQEGIKARKAEKARVEQIREYDARGDLPPPELLVPIREPDKNPTVIEQARLLEDFYPGLVQAIRELKAQQEPPTQLDIAADGDDVVISTTPAIYAEDEVLDIPDSSPPPPNYIDSSDAESIDSIRRNADFIAF